MSKENLLNRIVGGLIIFITGILIGMCLILCFVLWHHHIFAKEISIQLDPINAISVFINILLIIYATRTLTRKNEEERVEKDLLISRLGAFQDLLNITIKDFMLADKLGLIDVTSKIKTLRTDFRSICGLIRKYEFIDKHDENSSNIENFMGDIKDFFTDTPGPGGDVSIEEGNIKLGAVTRQKIEETMNRVKTEMFDLVVLINRKK